MPNNILSAITNIANFKVNNLKDYTTKSNIRINAVGEQLEYYIKDAIAGTFNKKLEEKNYELIFSYLGNQNNPPDMIVKDSDAFEIKKIEGKNSGLALNSSFPKDVLHADDKRITSFCRSCEDKKWEKKDLFYVIGSVQQKIIHSLFFIQGTCYCANREIYERIHEPLKKEINNLIHEKDLESGQTTELGRVKRVDPLGITDLRIRGMWDIQNPIKVFSDLCVINEKNTFSVFVILKKEKYNSFPKEDILKLEKNNKISIKDIKIKDPNNPTRSIDSKLIQFGF